MCTAAFKDNDSFKNLVMIRIVINGKVYNALIDTGASISVIPISLVQNVLQPSREITIFSALGRVTCNKLAFVKFRMDQIPINFTFPFYAMNTDRIILGNDILSQLRISIDFSNKCLMYKNFLVPFRLNSCEVNHATTTCDDENYKVRTGRLVTLPPKMYTMLEVNVSCSDSYFCPSEKLMEDYNIIMPPMYIPKVEKVFIPILNLNERPVVLQHNAVLGGQQAVVELHHCNYRSTGNSFPSLNNFRHNFDVNKNLHLNEKNEIARLLREYSMIFATSETDIGSYPGQERMKIETTSDEPVHQLPYRKSHSERRTIREYIQKFLKLGIIEESTSEYASPILLVRKKDNSFRIVIDYRALNAITKAQIFPMPRLADIFDTLYEAKYFSKMDISNGFFNFMVDDNDKHKTAFITQDGLFQFRKCPQGLKNSPAFFNRVLRKVFHDLLFKSCFLYLDDILIYSKTFSDHVQHLRQCLDKLKRNGLKLKPSKCSFAYQELKILGHVLSHEGIKTDPDKVSAVVNMPQPKDVSEVRTFLGMTSYYRRFIENYAALAKPLTNLTRKENEFNFDKSCQLAFKILKEKLVSAPILAQFREDLDVILYCDASLQAIGCVLTQYYDNREHVIAYASKTLSQCEQNYSIAEKECLAVKYGLNHFYEYCFQRKITVVTDHHSLCSLLRTKNSKNLRIARWALEVQEADITVRYRKGSLHGNADCLSRLVPLSKPCTGYDSSLCLNTVENKEQYDFRKVLREEYTKDKFLSRIVLALKNKMNNKRFKLVHDLIYFVCPITHKEKLCIPESLSKELFSHFHDNIVSGHAGINKCYLMIKSKYYIHNLRHLLTKYINNCMTCARRNPRNIDLRGNMQTSEISNVFDKWVIDIIGPLNMSENGNKYIIVGVDSFSKYVVASYVKQATSLSLCNFIVKEIMLRFGVPRHMQFDNASINKSNLVRKLLEISGTKTLYITPYQHQSQGLVENMNKTIEIMLSKYCRDSPNSWDTVLPIITYAINCNVNFTTRFSPYEIVYGRKPMLPFEMYLNLPSSSDKISTRNLVKYNIIKAQQSYGAPSNKDVIDVQPGRFCMVKKHMYNRNVSPKLQDQFSGPYRIVRKLDNLRYKLKCCFPSKKKFKIMHVDQIKLLGSEFSISSEDNIVSNEPPQLYKTRSGRTVKPVIR